ncbi:MAG: hypothetical protein MUC42_11530, partial [Bryobacter sp.]|jgi:hypothetical protein|nr:hypothetical protein [Bryobacter sp.]
MTLTRRHALASAALAAAPAPAMPTVAFGSHQVSRLIVGGNPVSGHSHMDPAADREMVDYFTAENTKRLLRDCARNGVNTWQSRADRHILRLLHEYRQEGGTVHWIAQTASEIENTARNIRDMMAEKPIGIYHHGSRTDALWQAGKIDEVKKALTAMRDAGARAGLGTHIPEVIDYVEDKGWDLDFYMTCLYNLSRPRDEADRLAGGKAPRELFWHPDREAMLKRVRLTSKQCLVFKVYGASRNCQSEESMLAALRLAFQSAKPNDAIVVGMFPKHKEQVAENCRLCLQAMRSAT